MNKHKINFKKSAAAASCCRLALLSLLLAGCGNPADKVQDSAGTEPTSNPTLTLTPTIQATTTPAPASTTQSTTSPTLTPIPDPAIQSTAALQENETATADLPAELVQVLTDYLNYEAWSNPNEWPQEETVCPYSFYLHTGKFENYYPQLFIEIEIGDQTMWYSCTYTRQNTYCIEQRQEGPKGVEKTASGELTLPDVTKPVFLSSNIKEAMLQKIKRNFEYYSARAFGDAYFAGEPVEIYLEDFCIENGMMPTMYLVCGDRVCELTGYFEHEADWMSEDMFILFWTDLDENEEYFVTCPLEEIDKDKFDRICEIPILHVMYRNGEDTAATASDAQAWEQNPVINPEIKTTATPTPPPEAKDLWLGPVFYPGYEPESSLYSLPEVDEIVQVDLFVTDLKDVLLAREVISYSAAVNGYKPKLFAWYIGEDAVFYRKDFREGEEYRDNRVWFRQIFRDTLLWELEYGFTEHWVCGIKDGEIVYAFEHASG